MSSDIWVAMVLDSALDLIERCNSGRELAAACGVFGDALRDFGVSSLAARTYRRPVGRLNSSTLWAAGGFVASNAPSGWVGSAAHRYICLEQNPLLRAVEERRTHFRWSDLAPHGEADFDLYWEAFREGGFADGLGMIAFGRGRRTASLSLGFQSLALSARETSAILFAGHVLLERLLNEADPGDEETVALTPRERDCLGFVAEGKSDWEIGKILSIAQATAHSHIENAKRKLGARTRAQAVAKFYALGLA